MRIITWNINGYRSAEKYGYLAKLIEDKNPDIKCLQEIKMNEKIANSFGYETFYNFAQKKRL